MLNKNIGPVAREQIAQDAAAHARQRRDEDDKEAVRAVPGLHGHARAADRKNAEARRICQQQDMLIEPLVPVEDAPHRREKDDDRHRDRDQH